MIGAIIGDIVGSRFENRNRKSTNFRLFAKDCSFTDDTVMTLAVAKALIKSISNEKSISENAVKYMQELGLKYPNCGFGSSFYRWLHSKNPKPYNSFGNGAAMRISPVAWMSSSMKMCTELSDIVTGVSHNHPDGLRGARAAALATYLARQGATKNDIRNLIENHFYSLNFTIDEIRPTYKFDVSCQGSVPQAIRAFLESDGFEDAIRLAVSIGGDSDTIAAITGGIAEAYYGVPDKLREEAVKYLTPDLLDILNEFESSI